MPFDKFIDLSAGVSEGGLPAAAAAGDLPRVRAFLLFWEKICERKGADGERFLRNGSCDAFIAVTTDIPAIERDALVSKLAAMIAGAQNISEARSIFAVHLAQEYAEIAKEHAEKESHPENGNNEGLETLPMAVAEDDAGGLNDIVGLFDDEHDNERENDEGEGGDSGDSDANDGEIKKHHTAAPTQATVRLLQSMFFRRGSSLMLAAQNGHIDCLRELLPYHEPRRANGEGLTALHLAAAHGHADCAALLIPRSDTAARISWTGDYGYFGYPDYRVENKSQSPTHRTVLCFRLLPAKRPRRGRQTICCPPNPHQSPCSPRPPKSGPFHRPSP